MQNIWQFDTEKKAWLLVEEHLKDFAKPATNLKNGEGVAEKLYVSARKYIASAKINIKLEHIGYNEEFSSFDRAIEEIRKRLKKSEFSKPKIAFKNETIQK